MTFTRSLPIVLLALLILLLQGCASGLQGGVFSKSTGAPIPNATLTFVKEDGSTGASAVSSATGRYSIALSPARYYMIGSHPAFEDSHSSPGFAVVQSNTVGTANFFLREPQVTTVLIVRHGEKQNPNSNAPNEPLSAAGQARAQALRETVLRAGVTAVYSTDTVRTRDTVAPLAAAFRFNTTLYNDPAALASEVLADHVGDVVLVAAHSDTLASMANAFGAQLPTSGVSDFDNLLVVSRAGNVASVVNLQYGADSTPDVTRNDRHAMTLLLVGTSVPPGGMQAQELLHAARKAGVSAVYSSAAGNTLLAPLAGALAITPTVFNAADMPTFASLLLGSHAQDTVVVAASPDELRELIRQLGAEPFPVIYTDDTDHLVVVTRFTSGAMRVLPLRF